jgi:hypothetical protein
MACSNLANLSNFVRPHLLELINGWRIARIVLWQDDLKILKIKNEKCFLNYKIPPKNLKK